MPRLLTIPEAEKELNLSAPTLRKYIKQGRIPALRFGKSVRIPSQAIDDWIADELAATDYKR